MILSVKDFLTKEVLLCCDSSGDLHPITAPSHQALIVIGPFVWQQRLGHPGDTVFKQLISSKFIQWNKTKSNHHCSSCQAGKHVLIPFSLSDSNVSFPFDLVHYDVWSSPLVIHSGLKYYVIFQDHFSHYVWVCPLQRKSGVFTKFVHFLAFVRNQFNRDIKAFQCDNGGEYNNRAFRDLCDSNGIYMHFSCPYTSQQNGKSELMLRTINNIVGTFL